MFATVDQIAHGPELSEVNSSVRLKQAKALPNMRTPDKFMAHSIPILSNCGIACQEASHV